MNMEKIRIAVTGASGMLGTAILDLFKDQYAVFANSRTEGYAHPNIEWTLFDLLDVASLKKWLHTTQPHVVVHCAAIVNVDACEKNIAQAEAVHATAAAIIGETIASWSGRLIYVSTDAVFDGTKKGAYQETDHPEPLSVYGKTKLQGETITLAQPNSVVLRTTIFGWNLADQPSFAEWILKGLAEQKPLTMFTDVIFSPIHVSHFAAALLPLIAKPSVSGLFHLSGSSALSKYDFAIKMAEIFKLSTEQVKPIKLEDAGLLAKRAKNMVLANNKLSTLLQQVLPTVEAGIECFKDQYDNGWLARVKNKTLKENYHFWR